MIRSLPLAVLTLGIVQTLIIKRRKRRDQCCLKTHRPRQEIARQHTPRALFASHVPYAGDFVDHDSQFSLAANHIFNDEVGNADRWRHAKAAAPPIGYKRPTAQKRVPLAVNRDRMKTAFQTDVKIRAEPLLE